VQTRPEVAGEYIDTKFRSTHGLHESRGVKEYGVVGI
jgi:hypothetical protein